MAAEFSEVFPDYDSPTIVTDAKWLIYDTAYSGNIYVRATEFVDLTHSNPNGVYGGGAIRCTGAFRLLITLCRFFSCYSTESGGAICSYFNSGASDSCQFCMVKTTGKCCRSHSINQKEEYDICNQGQFMISYVNSEKTSYINKMEQCSCAYCPWEVNYRNQRPFSMSGGTVEINVVNSTNNYCQNCAGMFVGYGIKSMEYVNIVNCSNSGVVNAEFWDCKGTIKYLTIQDGSHKKGSLGFFNLKGCDLTFDGATIENCDVSELFLTSDTTVKWINSYVDSSISLSLSYITVVNSYSTKSVKTTQYYDEEQRKVDLIPRTPINTLYNTPINTLFNTPINTLFNTPINTLFNTPINTLFNTMFNTPFKTVFNTPIKTLFDTPFRTLYNTPFKTLYDTPFKTLQRTLSDTPYLAAYPTLAYTLYPTQTPHMTNTFAPSPEPTDVPESEQSNDSKTALIAGSAAGGSIGLILIILAVIFIIRKFKKARVEAIDEDEDGVHDDENSIKEEYSDEEDKSDNNKGDENDQSDGKDDPSSDANDDKEKEKNENDDDNDDEKSVSIDNDDQDSNNEEHKLIEVTDSDDVQGYVL